MLEEKSLSEVFRGNTGEGWTVDGEEGMGELGDSAVYSDVGDGGSWVLGNGVAGYCCC